MSDDELNKNVALVGLPGYDPSKVQVNGKLRTEIAGLWLG
jgi:hypothetical protein